MKKTYWIVLFFAFTLGVISATSTSLDAAESITVDVRQASGSVNYGILGNNIELSDNPSNPYNNNHLDGGGVWDPDSNPPQPVPEVLNYAKASGLSYARFTVNMHNYDWKNMVGDVNQRTVKFGIPEFLKFTKDAGAEPLFIISDYNGMDERDAAELVEYLNGNSGAWAVKRDEDKTALGLVPGPWNVKWFEYGNETYMGPDNLGGGIVFTAEEYAERYIAYRQAMRAVNTALNENDQIKLGAVIYFPSFIPDSTDNLYKEFLWSEDVISRTGQIADFYIIHKYSINGKMKYLNDQIFEVALAESNDQLRDYFIRLNIHIRNMTGGSTVPFAVTEFNGPLGHSTTLGNSLVVSDYIRQMMYADNLLFANFYAFTRGGYAMISPQENSTIIYPSFNVFQFYNSFFGDELIKPNDIRVVSDTYITKGDSDYDLSPASGDRQNEHLDIVQLNDQWTYTPRIYGATTTEYPNGIIAVSFDGTRDVDYHHAYKTVAVEPDTWYRLSGYIKTEDLHGSVTYNFEDGNNYGWNEVKNSSCHDCTSNVVNGVYKIKDIDAGEGTYSILDSSTTVNNTVIETEFKSTILPGLSSDALVVFDFKNARNFTFVMANEDECIFGKYNGSFKWSGSCGGGFPAGQSHSLKVLIDGSIAKVYADIGNTGTYIFRGESDFGYIGSNKVGVGSRNSEINFNNVNVYGLNSDEGIYLQVQDKGLNDFDNGNSDDWNIPSGQWSVNNGEYVGHYEVFPNNPSTNIATFTPSFDIETNSSIIETDIFIPDTTGAWQNGYIIFDYINENNFKYIGANMVGPYWTIGELINGNWKTADKVFAGGLSTEIWYRTKIIINDNTVSLYVDEGRDGGLKFKTEYTFDSINSHSVGLVTKNSPACFDNFILNNYCPTLPADTSSPVNRGTTRKISGTSKSATKTDFDNIGYWYVETNYKSKSSYDNPDKTVDAKIIINRDSGNGIITGKAEFKGVRLEKITQANYGAVPYLSVTASKSEDKSKVYLMVVNKNMTDTVTANIDFIGFNPLSAQAWTLEGVSIDAGYNKYMNKNGEFENGYADWVVGSNTNIISRPEGDPEVYFGNKSAKAVFNNEIVDDYDTYQTITVIPNTKYIIEGHVKTSNIATYDPDKDELIEVDGEGIGISATENSGPEHITELLTGTKGWTYLTKEFTTLYDTNQVVLKLRREMHEKKTTGTAWWDTVRLVEKGAYVTYNNIGDISSKQGKFSFTFPKHSLTAIEITNETDQNILPNSGFEEYDHLDYTLKNWVRDSNPSGATTTVDNYESHNGISSIRMDFNNSDVEYLNIDQANITLAPYTRYMIEGYIKTDSLAGNGQGASISVEDLSNNKAYFTNVLKGNNAWTYVSKEFTTGPDDTPVKVILKSADSGCGTAWFDDIRIYDTTDPIIDLKAKGQHKSIELKWKHLPWATSYMIYRRSSTADTYELIEENFQKGEIEKKRKACCKFRDTKADMNKTYFYVVRGVNVLGYESPDSNEASASLK